MKANMKNIKSQQELVEQLLKAGNSLIVVQFLSPRCPACKALHSKVNEDKYVDFTIFLTHYQ
jgi:thiol-disulfide isomerase/thioredoxin